MVNLIRKDIRLGVHPLFLIMPLLTGALMFIPGWIYFIVILYFCWITIPNMFNQLRSQNDLMFTSMMPVTKRDIVKARIFVIAGLELAHVVVALVFGLISQRLYPDLTYVFFPPNLGFFGLCLAMLAIFNLVFIPMYYKTAYKFGMALLASTVAATLFAGITQWVGIAHSGMNRIFYGTEANSVALQAFILIAGIVIFLAITALAYRIAVKRFLQVEIQ
ncbi:ABC-2 transporter permease [Paenibacillus sp. MBLB2552]|uniref:ABC-2 transporter permease n=1 Tax=Paenibacillus mellifer TaxID=2937794 RepID=A0A9X1XZ61_9BACL|nr:ABC-2 transporter permease [Paenibacillus mellifer]MCK8487962.1 ABC-2 transporter permease [Paenibacillus mellifer]